MEPGGLLPDSSTDFNTIKTDPKKASTTPKGIHIHFLIHLPADLAMERRNAGSPLSVYLAVGKHKIPGNVTSGSPRSPGTSKNTPIS